MNVNHLPAACIYSGPSCYNGEPIRAYLVAHRNGKTGMACGLVITPAGQTYWEARRIGADTAVCGGCKARSKASGGDGSCYVGNGSRIGMSLAWLAKVDDLPVDWKTAGRLLCMLGRLRSAVWGDAAALPQDVWATLEALARGIGAPILGYTHGWRIARHLIGSHMASVDSAAEAAEAQALGWRTFRVGDVGSKPERGEFSCPASAERGHKISCGECLACGTEGYRRGSRSVLIWRHDSAGQQAFKRLSALSLAN